jgi:hypothetical protein
VRGRAVARGAVCWTKRGSRRGQMRSSRSATPTETNVPP